MKTPLCLLFLSTSLLPVTAQEYMGMESYEEEPETRLFGSIASPVVFPDGDDWDYSAGIEGRLGITLGRGLRIYGLLGYSYWYTEGDAWIDGFDSEGVEGDAGVFSVGGGIEYMVEINPSHSFSFGANYQYQYVDSHVDYNFSTPFLIEREKIHIDDASAVYAGVDYYFHYNPSVALSFGLGYLFNIDTAGVSFQGEHVKDTKFEGFTLRVGAEF
ncbi:outer membrane protein [Puniceicoccus vermicola]|uniref:Outer membrane protein beta-barrel domain-containing protein n=1 Tax=Puniceicoccus vermicola TaxID=388746 RepID=A0A7X1E489_9BACT|nr:outer membrane beta-barrel protein [Puniceicoccus vermicola]MBC2601789.1 hypothetical protein [Puniceicoccus vermicola]